MVDMESLYVGSYSPGMTFHTPLEGLEGRIRELQSWLR